MPRLLHLVEFAAVQLEDTELALHKQDARLDGGHGAQRQVGDPFDGKPWRYFDDERVLALQRRVAAGAGRRSHVRSELRLKVGHQQVHAQLRRSEPRRLRWRVRVTGLRWCPHVTRRGS